MKEGVVADVFQTDDNDSTLGDDSGSELNYGSVTSSIYHYRQENGRTYHAVCYLK